MCLRLSTCTSTWTGVSLAPLSANYSILRLECYCHAHIPRIELSCRAQCAQGKDHSMHLSSQCSTTTQPSNSNYRIKVSLIKGIFRTRDTVQRRARPME